jgi:hypothetical protein
VKLDVKIGIDVGIIFTMVELVNLTRIYGGRVEITALRDIYNIRLFMHLERNMSVAMSYENFGRKYGGTEVEQYHILQNGWNSGEREIIFKKVSTRISQIIKYRD